MDRRTRRTNPDGQKIISSFFSGRTGHPPYRVSACPEDLNQNILTHNRKEI